MAVDRSHETPTCPECGKPTAKERHKDQSDIPISMRVIGDTFLGWEKIDCDCTNKYKQDVPELNRIQTIDAITTIRNMNDATLEHLHSKIKYEYDKLPDSRKDAVLEMVENEIAYRKEQLNKNIDNFIEKMFDLVAAKKAE